MISPNPGRSVTLVPIMQSIGLDISPVREIKEPNTFLTDLTPVGGPLTSRFKTPSARTLEREDLVQGTGLKYLNSNRMNKETVSDYISTSRLMLRKNLTNEARKKDLNEVRNKYDHEVQDLKKAELNFEDDFQRFITMKADMENLNQLGSE